MADRDRTLAQPGIVDADRRQRGVHRPLRLRLRPPTPLDAIDAWLHTDEPVERLKALLRPVDEQFLVARPVSQRVNSVKYDDPECLEEAEPETQGSLL